MKRVSILLSCFNATELIERYITALLDTQITSVATLIAIDFPFSHKNPQLVQKELSRYPDVVRVQKEQNMSLYDAWNLAIDLASTEFVGNLNLDDRVSADYYTVATDALATWPADVYSTFALATTTIGQPSADAKHQDHLPRDRFAGADVVEYGLNELVTRAPGRVLKQNIPHCAPVWRRSLHKELGYFDSASFDFCADYEFWLRVAAANKKLLVSKERKTVFYRANGTASDRLMHLSSEEIIKRWKPAFPPPNYKPTHLGQTHDLLHFCFNMNAIFSSEKYYSHVSPLDDLGPGFEAARKSSPRERPAQQRPETRQDNPHISVICPVYNAAPFFAECIESVLNQGIADLELIIVDDGSTDGSVQIANRWAEQDARIRLITNQGAKGVSGARNTGLQAARGQYIAFLDADDRYDDGALRARLGAFEANPTLDLVHGCYRFVDPSGKYLGITLGTIKFVSFLNMSVCPIHLNTVAGRADLLKKFRFAEGLTNGEDWLFIASVLRSGVRSYFIEGGGASYRVHAGSTVARNVTEHETKLQSVLDWIYSRTDEQFVDDDYRQGLESPLKFRVMQKRQVSLYLSLLLVGDVAQCRALMSDAELLAFMKRLKGDYYWSAIRTSFARRFLLSIEEAAELPPDSKQQLSTTIAALDLANVLPELHHMLVSKVVPTQDSTLPTPQAKAV